MDEMDPVFRALANGERRRMLDVIKNDPGCSVADVAAKFAMSRIAVMKHLKILEQADLVVSEKEGRVRRLYHNAVPIQLIYERWTTEYSAHWAGTLTRLKYGVEAASEDDSRPAAKDTARGGATGRQRWRKP